MNQKSLADILNDKERCEIRANDDEEVRLAVNEIIQDINRFVLNLNVRQVIGWLLWNHFWMERFNFKDDYSNKRGLVVNVQLGYGLDPEFAFSHPCVVLGEINGMSFVVPMTSKKAGVENEMYIDISLKDSSEKSTLLLDQARLVSRKRIKGLYRPEDQKNNKKYKIILDDDILKEIEIKLSKTFFKYLNDVLDENSTLRDKVLQLEREKST